MTVEPLKFLDDAGNPKQTYREWTDEERRQSLEHIAALASHALKENLWKSAGQGVQEDEPWCQVLIAISETANAPMM